MLYAHVADAKNSASESDRSEYGELGLGAVVPHAANLQSTPTGAPGGGGYGVLGVGGGQPAGQPGGTVPIAGTAGTGYAPVGRTTSPIFKTGKNSDKGGKSTARNVFQASAQGSRVGEGSAAVPTALKGQAGSKSSGFPVGGLYGLHGLNSLSGSKPLDDVSGLSGFFNDLFKGNISKAFTPPGGKITRIAPLASIAQVLPTPVRTAIRYAGAVPFTATVGLFTPASVPRQIFGLSPTESKYQEIGAKVARVVAATVATAGAAAYLMPASAPALGPGTTAIGGYAPSTAFVGSGGGAVPLATVGGHGAAGAYTAASWAPAAIPTAAGVPSIGVVTGVTASSPLGVSAAGVPVQAGSSTWLAAHPVTAAIGKTVGTVTLATLAQKVLQGPGQPGSQSAYESGGTVVDMGGAGQSQGQPMPIILGGGGSSGGGSSDPGITDPLVSASLPMIVAGGAIVFVVAYKLLKRKS